METVGSIGGVGIGQYLPGETPTRSLDFTEVVRPQRVREIYNPNPEAPVVFSYNAEIYTLPPADKLLVLRDPFTRKRMTWPKPGVLPLYDIRFSVRGQRYSILADELVEVACGRDGRSGQIGVLGVRPLFGDDRDAAVIEEAQEAHGVRRDAEALDRTRTHENNVALARANGDVAPRPTQQIMLDYEWLQRRDLSKALRFACEVCNLGFREEREMLVHIVAHHKAHPAAADAARALKITGANAAQPVHQAPASISAAAIAEHLGETADALDEIPDVLDLSGPEVPEGDPNPAPGDEIAPAEEFVSPYPADEALATRFVEPAPPAPAAPPAPKSGKSKR